jgi:hypothetical protein
MPERSNAGQDLEMTEILPICCPSCYPELNVEKPNIGNTLFYKEKPD